MSIPFLIDQVEAMVGVGKRFGGLGLATAEMPRTLTFLDMKRYATGLGDNRYITGVITTQELAHQLPKRLDVIVADDPQHSFYTLHNRLATLSDAQLTPSSVPHLTDDSDFR